MAINFPEGWQNFPGRVVKVIQDGKTDAWNTLANLNTKAQISGLSAQITMSAPGNVVLVILHLGMVGASGDTTMGGVIRRNGNWLHIADASGVKTRNTFGGGIPSSGGNWRGFPVSMCIVDSPGAGTHTYDVLIGGNGGQYISVNYDYRDFNSSTDSVRTSSTLTLIEFEP